MRNQKGNLKNTFSTKKGNLKNTFNTNDNENTTTQNLWDATKALFRGNFIAIQAFFRKEDKSQVNNLTHYLKELEKEEQTKPKVSIRKEIIKIREEIKQRLIKPSIKPRAGSLKGQTKLTNL